MAEFEVGKMYFGPENMRVSVIETTPRTVVVRHFLSHEIRKLKLSEMREFVAASDRRTYRNKKERRMRIEIDDDQVRYLDGDGQLHSVKRKSWDKWRAKAV